MEHFVKLFDFTPMESIVAATAGVAKLFMQEDELGKILPQYYADCILVNGDPLKDISILQDHDKLDVIMINGRIHKSAPSDFVTQPTQTTTISSAKNYNFVAFEDRMGRSRIGHLEDSTIYSLTMASGSPLSNMYQVIELNNDVRRGEESFSLDSVKLLPPLAGRDVLCIGNNYADHVKECNPDGVDTDRQKKAPLLNVFTKRNTSVIASNQDIYAHAGFTETLDYEGEVGVIIGKPGFQISESNAMDYVWGFTIINGK
ncbi:5-carboxymethyl-2-hydroxymuconate isomerase [Penicillium lagena]|uniref:5-carboxymethyl-2-hydroxymuconate isomerase n=1 Tax=Penicillium lagena TaxID=94218 RepID=UPI00253FA5DA|nr:5-carboxymethyl-2-hydroxymuconate isomerase [Penicillium lagena]KAJ5610235.1 5-carboxymethyl-2-hydroxymuconate isomerase [Penicillium lagena]